MGNSQTLPNGNTLVCTATSGTVLEIDTNQKTLWSIAANPAKAYRYSGCYVSGTLPATPSVIQSNDTLSSSANGTSYMWFLNGYKIDGAVSKTYIPAVSGIYQVQVYSSSDCGSEISAKYTFTATTTNLPESTQASKISIYPNPVSDIIHIDMTLQNINWEVGVYNVLGERVILESNVTGVSVSSFPNGIYLLVVSSNGKQLNNTKIIINH